MLRGNLMTLVLAVLASTWVGCTRTSDDSQVQTIVGVNSKGQEAALALLPVRNFSVATLGGSSTDPGVLQAAAIVKARLFALVECVSVKNSKGETLSAAELMSAVEMRAAVDDLYLDESRFLLTSADDDHLARYGSTDNKLVVVPCRVHGSRLLSWAAMSDIEVRAAGLPAKLPAPGVARDRVQAAYRLAQAVHLSVRGSYYKDKADEFMPRLPSITGMAREQAGLVTSADSVAKRLRKADALFNVCDKSSTASILSYAASLKSANFACVPHPTLTGVYSYRAGGAKGNGYEVVKDLLAKEIAATHASVFPASGKHDPSLYALWDLLTAARPWREAKGLGKDLGTYLTSGKGLDFAATFKSNAKGAVAAPKTADLRSSSLLASAPLALGIPKSKSRAQLVRRATTKKQAGFSILQGGQRSTADGRSDKVEERLESSAGLKSMGSGAAVSVERVETDVASAMTLLRTPR